MIKFVSWNVNGLRASLGKDFMASFQQFDADFFCLQETKLQEGQVELALDGYVQFWNSAEKKGYSGTAIFAKRPPLSVQLGIGLEEHDREGRVITLEYADFYLVTVYTPNAQKELARLSYRMQWELSLIHIFTLFRRIYGENLFQFSECLVFISLLLMLPLLVDCICQYCLKRISTNLRRGITGAICGIGIGLFSLEMTLFTELLK